MKDFGHLYGEMNATTSTAAKVELTDALFRRASSPALSWPFVHCKSWLERRSAKLRHLIRTLNYVVSTQAAEEIEDDNLSILDF